MNVFNYLIASLVCYLLHSNLNPVENHSLSPTMAIHKLLAPKPRRKVALALGSALLDLAVELVDLLERVGLGGLCVGLGVALGLGNVSVDGLDLCFSTVSTVKVACISAVWVWKKVGLTAWSTLAPISCPALRPCCSASVERYGSSLLILAAARCASPGFCENCGRRVVLSRSPAHSLSNCFSATLGEPPAE